MQARRDVQQQERTQHRTFLQWLGFGRQQQTTPTTTTEESAPVESKSYYCPYCGYTITKDNILFVDRGPAYMYLDRRAYAFLRLCHRQWKLETMFSGGRKPGLYYRMEDIDKVGVVNKANGWPSTVWVRPCKGHTPTELDEIERQRCLKTKQTPSELVEGQEPSEPVEGQEQPARVETPTKTGAPEIQPLTDFWKLYEAVSNEKFEDDPPEERTDQTQMQLGERACPNCHCLLHPKFGAIETINVTMFGGRSSGKTAYLMALSQCLEDQLPALGLGSVMLLDPSQAYFKDLYRETGPEATPTDEKLFPFVFYYSNDNNGKQCFIAFYDMAGEYTNNVTAMLGHPGLQHASTMMLMIDPNQLISGGYFDVLNQGTHNVSNADDGMHRGPETMDTHMGNVSDADYGMYRGPETMDTYMGNVSDAGSAMTTDSEQEGVGSFNEGVDTFLQKAIEQYQDLDIMKNINHVIVVMTKMDMPITVDGKLFGSVPGAEHSSMIITEPLQEDEHQGAVDVALIERIGVEMNDFIRKKMNKNANYSFLQTVMNKFKDRRQRVFNLLGVSVYSRVKQDANSQNVVFKSDWSKGSTKHRVIEPFLVILVQNGLVGWKRYKIEPGKYIQQQ